MKKFLLTPLAVLVTGLLTSQVYFQDDFSSGNLSNWTLYDEDGDGENWEVVNEEATSFSWTQAQGALTPDNWMVSQMIDLTGATGDINLEWMVKAQDQGWPDENYSVYVGTSDDISVMETNGADFNEVVGATNDEFVFRDIDLSSFAGDEIYVAFRHHDVTDQFRVNIDNVVVRTPPENDLKLNNITVDTRLVGDRVFSIEVFNNGTNAQTDFDLDWEFGTDSGTENITGINLLQGASHVVQVNVNDVQAGQNQEFDAEITTTDEDMTNNSLTVSFNFEVPVPQYVSTSSTGDNFNLHDRLVDGQAILLDFMASWCTPCESSTPDISEWVENNGSGEGRVEALAISIEQNDDDNTLNNLNWHGGFYEYPKFAYSNDNIYQYAHYAVNHGFNTGGSIPFFVLICPDIQNPAFSEIILEDVGYIQGMFVNNYETALNSCPTATLDIIDLSDFSSEVKLYPNPTSNNVNIEFETKSAIDTKIEIINTMGQIVYSDVVSANGFNNLEVSTSSFESGIYQVKITTDNERITKRLSVVK